MKHFIIPASTYHKLKSTQSQHALPKVQQNDQQNIQHEHQPVLVEPREEEEEEQESFVTEAFPKSTRGKATRLLNYIKRHNRKTTWSSKTGDVSIDGTLIQGSNIIDLLRTAVSGTVIKPTGWPQFHIALKAINTPLSLVARYPPGIPVQKKLTKWLTH